MVTPVKIVISNDVRNYFEKTLRAIYKNVQVCIVVKIKSYKVSQKLSFIECGAKSQL